MPRYKSLDRRPNQPDTVASHHATLQLRGPLAEPGRHGHGRYPHQHQRTGMSQLLSGFGRISGSAGLMRPDIRRGMGISGKEKKILPNPNYHHLTLQYQPWLKN